MRKLVCIISFSPIWQDARVMRQIQSLSQIYNVVVIGYGPQHPEWQDRSGVAWYRIADHNYNPYLDFFIKGMYLIGRCWKFSYESGYWIQPAHHQAYQCALSHPCDIYLANDVEALPIAAQAAKHNNGKLVFDAHEYAPLEFEERKYWWVIRGQIEYFLRKYCSQIDLGITVVPQIADRYRQDFGFQPIVIMNAPAGPPIPPQPIDPQHIRLIHHGAAISGRHLEIMIETIALCDVRYSMNFMLMPNQPNYLIQLKKLAEKIAPGRVEFHDPVNPEHIVTKVASFDIGIYPLRPTNYNNQVALPNKFFDFIMAGLGIVIGPSPAMAELVEKYSCGRVANSFEPDDLAYLLNQLSSEDINSMRHAASQAGLELNADKEMKKMIDGFARLSG